MCQTKANSKASCLCIAYSRLCDDRYQYFFLRIMPAAEDIALHVYNNGLGRFRLGSAVGLRMRCGHVAESRFLLVPEHCYLIVVPQTHEDE
jgi:hypothetical protein